MLSSLSGQAHVLIKSTRPPITATSPAQYMHPHLIQMAALLPKKWATYVATSRWYSLVYKPGEGREAMVNWDEFGLCKRERYNI